MLLYTPWIHLKKIGQIALLLPSSPSLFFFPLNGSGGAGARSGRSRGDGSVSSIRSGGDSGRASNGERRGGGDGGGGASCGARQEKMAVERAAARAGAAAEKRERQKTGKREVEDDGIFVQNIHNTYLSSTTEITNKYQWHRYKYTNSNSILKPTNF
jgi:hypothetical protein